MKKLLFLVVAIGLASNSARAAVSEVAFGLSFPNPMGAASQTLNRPTSFQAEAFYDNFGFGPNFDLHFQGMIQPYTVPSTNATITLDGLFAGLSMKGGKTFLGIVPFLAFDIGMVYDSLGFTGQSNVQSNSSSAFAIQAVPGIDLPIVGGFGLTVEFPITNVFVKNSFSIWSTVFSLRYAL